MYIDEELTIETIDKFVENFGLYLTIDGDNDELIMSMS